MSYITINENFYRCETYGPGGLKLALQYDPTTGVHRLIEKNAFGIGPAVFYQNGTYYSDAVQDPNLFTNKDPTKLTPAGQELSDKIRTTVYSTYTTLGGQTKGNVTDDSTKPPNQSGTPKVTNAAVGTSPGIAGNAPGLSNPPGQGNLVDIISPLEPLKPFNYAQSPSSRKQEIISYPDGLLKNNQDTLKIQEIIYKPPNENLFTGTTTNIKDLLSKGLTRGTTIADTGATIYLPIPNNARDSNNVSWGDDNMNSTTAAAASLVSQKPADFTAGLVGAEGLQSILNQAGLGGLAELAGRIPQAAMLGMLASNAVGSNDGLNLLKTSLQSLILSKYGFDVSPESILARGFGVVPNTNLQLLFNNVTLRSFTFPYIMSPRTKDESIKVNKILRVFKQGMAAKKRIAQAGGPSLFLGTPNVYKLEYLTTGGSSIKGINKFKICALTSFNVNYTPTNEWLAYNEGQPASVIMELTFKEIEPIFDNDYQENPELKDLASVPDDHIGY